MKKNLLLEPDTVSHYHPDKVNYILQKMECGTLTSLDLATRLHLGCHLPRLHADQQAGWHARDDAMIPESLAVVGVNRNCEGVVALSRCTKGFPRLLMFEFQAQQKTSQVLFCVQAGHSCG